ncbi:MAG: 2-aminoethylphosphonate--pyruvate transaminase [Janthinobacterium lividum]
MLQDTGDHAVEHDPAVPAVPVLLTPGPLTTAAATKQAMMRDWGSWDDDFRAMTASVRRALLAIAHADAAFDCVPLQGSGSYCVEAMLGSLVPRDGKALVLANGAYGQRIATTLRYLRRDHAVHDTGDYLPPTGGAVAARLDADPAITHVVAVHCETSSGILNPLAEIADATARRGRKLLIDAMSTFGAVPLDLRTLHCEAFVSSANKCLEGVPGFGFVLARKTTLHAAAGQSHSLSLDLHDQWRVMNRTGQWRFTPPTHAVAAFLTALELHAREGGQAGRLARYARNRDVLVASMREAGFETLLVDRWLSPIVVTFFSPADRAFDFPRFYDLMKQRGFVIYPGKLTVVDSFRIACIGQVDASVMRRAAAAARDALAALGVTSAAPSAAALRQRCVLDGGDAG